MKNLKILFYLLFIALIYSCTDDNAVLDSTENLELINSRFQKIQIENFSIDLAKNNYSFKGSSSLVQFMTDVNAELQNQGASIQLYMIEYYNSDEAGNTVFFNDRGDKQLDSDFVPGDPRRGGSMDIAYAYDGTEGTTLSGLTQAETDGAILSAMNTWDNVTCSDELMLTNLGATPFDLGYVQALLGLGGSFFYTDIMHSGFNSDLFDVLYGPGSNVLAVTFTYIWVTTDGPPTDIDNNGKTDVAFRDIYYNDSVPWKIGNHYDVETVVLHEAGHGLSQAHFGKLFLSSGNTKFHYAPRAVMNAGYMGILTTINGSDEAGHCSIWGEWPYN